MGVGGWRLLGTGHKLWEGALGLKIRRGAGQIVPLQKGGAEKAFKVGGGGITF